MTEAEENVLSPSPAPPAATPVSPSPAPPAATGDPTPLSEEEQRAKDLLVRQKVAEQESAERQAENARVVGRHLPHALGEIAAYLKTAIPTMESNQKAAAERACKLINLYLGRDNG